MPLPRRARRAGEEVVVDVRPHLTYLAGPGAATAAGVLVSLAVVVFFGDAPMVVGWLLTAAVVGPALWLLARSAKWLATSLVVTDQRVVLRRGLRHRGLNEVPLSRIFRVDVQRRLVDRLLGTGSLVLTVEGGTWVLDQVSDPLSLGDVIEGAMAGRRRPVPSRSAGPAGRWDVPGGTHPAASGMPAPPRAVAAGAVMPARAPMVGGAALEAPTVPGAVGPRVGAAPVAASAVATQPGRPRVERPARRGPLAVVRSPASAPPPSADPTLQGTPPGRDQLRVEEGSGAASIIASAPVVPPFRSAPIPPATTEGGLLSAPSAPLGATPGSRGSSARLDSSAIPRQIRELAELHQLGILTDQEFQDKKRELLDRM